MWGLQELVTRLDLWEVETEGGQNNESRREQVGEEIGFDWWNWGESR